MTPHDFRATVGALGLAQVHVAELFNVGPRSLRRWRDGERRVPHGIALLLHLLIARKVTIEDIAEAAAAVRPNASAAPDPEPAIAGPELRVVPTVEPPVDPDPVPTTAEAVYALARNDCRWPIGTPGEAGFRFCCQPAAAGRSYCDAHCIKAYLPRRPDAGARIGFGDRGWRPRPQRALISGQARQPDRRCGPAP